MNAIDPRRGRRAMSIRQAPGVKRRRWAARMIGPQLHRLIDRIDAGLESGTLEAVLPDGTVRILGGRAPGPACEVHLVRWRALHAKRPDAVELPHPATG